MRLTPTQRTVVSWLCRLALAGIYLYAAWPKLRDPAAFAKNIHDYQLLPGAFVNPMAIFLPWLEWWCGLAVLFIPALRRGAVLGIAAMTSVFIAAIASAMARGIDIDCGCFSTTGQGMRTGWLHLLLDAALLAACLLHGLLDRPSRENNSATANP